MDSMMADFDLPDSMTLHPTRRPVVHAAEFRSAMSAMAASVCIVAARHGDELTGRTVTSVLSLSASPPAVLVSIDLMSRLADFIAREKGFSLALLASDQGAIADAFAGKVPHDERFDSGAWGRWHSGQPLLTGAVTVFDCEVIGAMETGSHVLFAGAIVESGTDAGKSPLLWHRHGYHGLATID